MHATYTVNLPWLPRSFFLPPIILYAGLSCRKKAFFSNLPTIASLGILGTYIAFAVIALTLYGFSKILNITLAVGTRRRSCGYPLKLSSLTHIWCRYYVPQYQDKRCLESLIANQSSIFLLVDPWRKGCACTQHVPLIALVSPHTICIIYL